MGTALASTNRNRFSRATETRLATAWHLLAACSFVTARLSSRAAAATEPRFRARPPAADQRHFQRPIVLKGNEHGKT